MKKIITLQNLIRQMVPLFFALIFLAILGFMAVRASWIEPSQSPPSSNAPPFLNTGSDDQHKTGKIIVDDPTVSSDASGTLATKGYVDSQGGGANKAYYVVYTRVSDGCLPGYNTIDVNSIARPSDGFVAIAINDGHLRIGPPAARGDWGEVGQKYIQVRFSNTDGPTKICWKAFNPTSHPHASVINLGQDSEASCPSGYQYVSHSQLKGNNDYSYIAAIDSGLYMGYVNSWYVASNDYTSGGQNRTDTGNTSARYCFKIMGVNEDAETSTGVYPVVAGAWNQSACSALGSDYWSYDTADMAAGGSNGYVYVSMNDNSSIIGPLQAWTPNIGNEYNYVWAHYTHVPYMCGKYFSVMSGEPHATFMFEPAGQSCPDGYIGFSKNDVKGWNDYSFFTQTGHTIYLGGLYDWSRYDQDAGHSRAWTHTSDNDFQTYCLKVDNTTE